MATSVKYFKNRVEVLQNAADICSASLGNGKRPVVLCQNAQVVHMFKKCMAKKAASSVGVKAVTLTS